MSRKASPETVRRDRVAPDGPDSPAGLLVLAAVPIGNPADASKRLADELARADLVAVEDTRRLPRLLADLGVRRAGGRVVSLHDHNEPQRIGEVLQALAAGDRVLVLSDAGMPTVSDPGFRLVSQAVAAGYRVTCAPGPSAVLAALALSGLPVDRFCFEGFPPRRSGERARRLGDLATEPRTMVFFEAPHRLAATLSELASAFGPDRSAAVCRELTKTHEEVRRGRLGELAGWAADGVRGEITLVVAGFVRPRADPQTAAATVAVRVATGERLKDACRAVAADTGVPARDLYRAALDMGSGAGAPTGSRTHPAP